MRYLAKIEVKIGDVDCLIGVIDYQVTKGSYDIRADCPADYYGECEMDWDILNQNGFVSLELTRLAEVKWVEDVIHEFMAKEDGL